MNDRSLDEFVDRTDEEDTDGTGQRGENASTDDTPTDEASADGSRDTEADDPATDAEADDPATATSTWDPDGRECARCGATGRRRWQTEDGPVCEACKSW